MFESASSRVNMWELLKNPRNVRNFRDYRQLELEESDFYFMVLWLCFVEVCVCVCARMCVCVWQKEKLELFMVLWLFMTPCKVSDGDEVETRLSATSRWTNVICCARGMRARTWASQERANFFDQLQHAR